MAKRQVPTESSAWAAFRELGHSSAEDLAKLQASWGLERTGTMDQASIELVHSLREARRVAKLNDIMTEQAVAGRVTVESNEAAPELTVELVELKFRGEEILGRGATSDDGGYGIAFARRKQKLPLVVRVKDGENIAAVSEAFEASEPLTKVDLVVGSAHARGPTEYERVAADLRERIGKADVASLSEERGKRDLSFLGQVTRWDEGILTAFILSARLGRYSEVEPALFYALLRANALSPDPTRAGIRVPVTIDSPTDGLFYDAVLLAQDERRRIWKQAIAERIIPAELAKAAEGASKLLDSRRDEAERHFQAVAPSRILDSLSADAASGVLEAVAARIGETGDGDPGALFSKIKSAPSSASQRKGKAPSAAELIQLDPQIIELVEGLVKGGDDSRRSGPNLRATRDFELAVSAEKSPRADHQAMGALLGANAKFDLASGKISDLAGTRTGDAKTRKERQQLASELQATQRVFRLAPRYDQTKALQDAGIHSAAQIAAMGESRFVREAVATGAFSPENAREVYERAYNVNVATGIVASELRGLADAANVAASNSPTATAKLKRVARDNPSLKNLFSLVDLCACEECRSIAGAAAYMVDVLQFLKNRIVVDTTTTPPTPGKTARDVLFERRADLRDIDLSCDNTNVPLPYIDIVCELLEQAVSPDPGFSYAGPITSGMAPSALVTALKARQLDFTDKAFIQPVDSDGNLAVRDSKAVAKLVPTGLPDDWLVFPLRQTFKAAAELAAAPDFVNDAAYTVLAASQIAFKLPFDLPHQEARAYFKQFEVPRNELMKALAVGGVPAARDIAAEALGISDGERLLITVAAPAQQATYWNTGATDPTTVFNVVDSFLTRTGLDFPDLQLLLSLKYINPENKLFIKHLDSSCDTKQKRIQNLDAPALDRIHRFLRLQRALGWGMALTDQAIRADRLGNGQINDALLIKLAALSKLATRTNLKLPDLVIAFGRVPIDENPDKSPTRYAQIFLNKSANGVIDARLTPEAVKANEGPPAPLVQVMLADVAAALATALGAKPSDLDLLIADMAPQNALTFENLARLYGALSLAKALRQTIADYLLLKTLSGIEPLDGPQEALDFADANGIAAPAGTKLVDVNFWLNFTADDLSVRVPTDAQITAKITAIQQELQAAFTANKSPFDPALTADENKGFLAALVGKLPGVKAAGISSLQAIVDRTYADPAVTAPNFIDGLLGRFIDTVPIKALEATLAALPATPPAPVEAARMALLASILDAVSAYLYNQVRSEIIGSGLSDGIDLDDTQLRALLDTARLSGVGGNRKLGEILGDDALIDKVNTPPTLPAVTPAAFAAQFAAVRLLGQMAEVAQALDLKSDEISWLLTNAAALGWLELDTLPYQGGMAAITWASWVTLRKAILLLRRFPPIKNPADRLSPFLFRSVFDLALSAPAVGPLLDRLALVTGWDRDVLTDLDTRFSLSAANLNAYRDPETLIRLEKAVVPLRKLGLSVASAVPFINATLTAADAAALRLALKAKYPAADWLGVLKQLYNPVREMKRDALTAYLLAQNPDMETTDDLFDYFLVDVEMCACQPTSRIVSAHGSLQLFVQRCLLGIEPTAVADSEVDSGWKQWEWMQAFRVWQANRQVFLYCENWLNPSLRDDKTEPFVAFENTLAQSDLGEKAIEDATIQYLEAVDDLSFLEVMSSCYEESTFTHHVFARTKGGDPHTYYYRRFIQERVWTPWLKIDLDIKSDHLISFVRNGRLNLAWPIFSEEANPNQDTNVPSSAAGTPVAKTQKAWKIQLAISEYANGVWTPSRMSKDALNWVNQEGYYEQLPTKDLFRFVAMDMKAAGYSINCGFIDDGRINATTTGSKAFEYLGGFSLYGCRGYPEPFTSSVNLQFLPRIKNTEIVDLRYQEIDGNELTVESFFSPGQILTKTPNRFRVTHPQQLTLLDFILFLIEMWVFSRGTLRDAKLQVPLGTLMPFFYEDSVHDYVVIPGFYGREKVPPIRRTFSDIIKLTRDAVNLAKTYLTKFLADPAHDLNKLIQQLVVDPAYKALLDELRLLSKLKYGIEFANFYHPLICPLRRTLYQDGIRALTKREVQLQKTPFDFAAHYGPTSVVKYPYPIEDVDFTQGGSYSTYNWELFFHVPMMIANQLSKDQQFERAMDWFHYVFNPRDASSNPVPQKYWQTKPFFLTTDADYVAQRIDTIMNGIASDPSGLTIDDLRFAVQDWRANPFEPFRVARSRTVAFQQSVLMQYIDNLIDWGDWYFTQDTMESVNQATQMYVLAHKLLGPKPRTVPPVVTPPPETYCQLEAKIDLFDNAWLQIENLIPDIGALPQGGEELPPPPITLSSLYFCIPGNPNLDTYWERVADRLFKIRHCQDINGVERTLALFAPPIDPGALIAARAAGLSISQILAGLSAPIPHYRFTTMIQKATDFTNLVVQFGASLLSAIEKRDAEGLARLRSTQEIALLNAMGAVKQRNVDEAEAQIQVIQKSIELTQAKSAWYKSREYLNTGETVALVLNAVGLVVEAVSMGLDVGAAIIRMLPTFNIGIAGFGGSPTVSASWGSENIAGATAGFAQVSKDVAGMLHGGANIAATLGSYDRRQDEWDFQAQLADLELVQLNSQVAAAQIRLDIAKKDLAAHNLQVTNSAQADQFLRSKFSNTELYDYMVAQLGLVHYRAYQLALGTAHQAEKCMQFELGLDDTYIRYDYWNGQKKGLLSGDRLMADLKQLESAYLQKNKREYELTKHVSLAMLDPNALLELKSTGACTFSIPEAYFDLDHPGHYFRRLKTVSLTIPAVAGPFTSVSAKLSLVGNRYRKSTSLTGGYDEVPGSDIRFAYDVTAIQSVATSQGDNDSGLFELNFHDERYLPFEYAGAISSWRLELPQEFRQFDYDAISDVILNLRYTARDGGSGLRSTVEGQLKAMLEAMLVAANDTGLYVGLNIRRQFPDQWYELVQNGATRITLEERHLPFFTQGHQPSIDAATWVAGVSGAPGSTDAAIDGTTFTLSTEDRYGGRCAGSSPNVAIGTPFLLEAVDNDDLEELSLVVHYTLGS